METNKNGNKFREMLWIEGRLIKSPYFPRRSDALTWKATKIRQRAMIQALGQEYREQTKLNFAEYSSKWLQEKIHPFKSPSTTKNYERILSKHINPVLGKNLIKDIKIREADLLVKNLVDKGMSPKGMQDVISLLKQVLNEAERKEDISKNPLKHYKGPKVPERDFAYWDDTQVNAFLLAAKNNPYYSFFVTAIYTGMRKGEIAALTWDCINFSQNLITVKATLDKFGYRPSTKSGKIRFVPMNTFLKGFLFKLYQNRSTGSDYVFTYKGKPIDTNHLYRIFQSIQNKMGLMKTIRVHDLRHTFASQLMMKGSGSLYDLAEILGHADTKMTQRYAHLSPSHIAQKTQNLRFKAEEELQGEVTLILPLVETSEKSGLNLNVG